MLPPPPPACPLSPDADDDGLEFSYDGALTPAAFLLAPGAVDGVGELFCGLCGEYADCACLLAK